MRIWSKQQDAVAKQPVLASNELKHDTNRGRAAVDEEAIRKSKIASFQEGNIKVHMYIEYVPLWLSKETTVGDTWLKRVSEREERFQQVCDEKKG